MMNLDEFAEWLYELPYRMRNFFVKNPRCCQPGYCKDVAPEDYANSCHSCDLEDTP